MQRVYRQIARVAVTSISVFVTGESGTGKEVTATLIHQNSRRRHHPFVAVSCAVRGPRLGHHAEAPEQLENRIHECFAAVTESVRDPGT